MTYESKLIPTPEQAATIERNLDVCREVWNYALRERKDGVLSRKSPVNACSLVSEYIIPPDEPFPNYHAQAKRLNVNVPDVPFHGHPLGVDLGLDKFLATSDGELVDRPRFLSTLHRKLKSLQRRLKNKRKGSNNRHKLNRKIARLHQKLSDTRKDWHFKLAHHLARQSGAIFVEDIDLRSWARGMLSKHCLDAGFGQFVSILSWVCWKEDVYFGKVDKNGTSQTCPNCGTHTGKKTLDIRVHCCPSCGYTTHRDVAAAQVIRNRGVDALGHSVSENVCGDDAAGVVRQGDLAGSLRSRKPKR